MVNVNNRHTIKVAFILTVTVLHAGLLSCGQIQRILDAEYSHPDIPIEERDHVWVVDQNGIEVPVPGTWVLVSQTHSNSTSAIGESFTLPPDPPHRVLISDGTYTDDEDILWTKVKITSHKGDTWQFLERVDTSVSPHRLFVVETVDDNGLPLPEYGKYPFDLPRHNVQIWEKQ